MSLFFAMEIIYFDNSATTGLYDEAFNAMLPFLKDEYANPGTVYEYADSSKRAVAGAREEIAATLNAGPDEIYFTSGGTESDNWALKGITELARSGAAGKYGTSSSHIFRPHIITDEIEHHAVLNTCKWLEKNGCRISYVKPDSNGRVSASEIGRRICPDTVLISVMTVNNELGTLQPVDKIAALAHEHGIPFHTDAVAAYGHIPINVKDLNIDLLSAGAHKFNGPKGIGFLYVNENYKLQPFVHGGAQEQGRRAGTLNVAGIAGMAAAAVKHNDNMAGDLRRRIELDRYFLHKLEEASCRPDALNGKKRIVLNGPDSCIEYGSVFGKDDAETGRLPGSFSLTVPGINAEELIVRLGMMGICVSALAACAASQGGTSHVLRSIGLDRAFSDSTIRISMNEDNTEEEIDIFFDRLYKLLPQ